MPLHKEAIDELKLLLASFANDTGPHTANVLRLANEDYEMREWVGRIQEWMQRVLLELGCIVEDQYNRDGIGLRKEDLKFYDDKYKAQFDEFFDAVISRLGSSYSPSLFDVDGKLVWKPELWSDIRHVIILHNVDKVGYIPTSHAEFFDQNLDLVIENLTLNGMMALEAHNLAKFSPYDDIHDESHHNVIITLGQIQADLRDIKACSISTRQPVLPKFVTPALQTSFSVETVSRPQPTSTVFLPNPLRSSMFTLCMSKSIPSNVPIPPRRRWSQCSHISIRLYPSLENLNALILKPIQKPTLEHPILHAFRRD
ncbi:hypothetical protein M422DRAFT_276972 [Sphaerobolus stellatus SS14]|uniref:Unplaced genomic scaffold SPHSTscaffold_1023, whole genome shotgun sequence n=1 Tax=Sphaerobolus stellatus (strain SS14) TaxID=990650 RepID=A0A0C9T1D0_SPHS4|nr:hypothetical protein M422DRAFT_276972 [Sphaerobolus stellatus SS14]